MNSDGAMPGTGVSTRSPNRLVASGMKRPHDGHRRALAVLAYLAYGQPRLRRVNLSRRSEIESFYRSYHQRCNDHEFGALGDFVAEDVLVNGEIQGLAGYVAGLGEVVRAFPDYRWNLHRLLIEDPWISAHFLDTGTHLGTFLGIPATGRDVKIQEFALYRLDAGRITEVWVTADHQALLDQLR